MNCPVNGTCRDPEHCQAGGTCAAATELRERLGEMQAGVCPMCGQQEPPNSEHVKLARARNAVVEAWRTATYAQRLSERIGFIDAMTMIDDAIAAVRAADAESERLAREFAAT